MILVVSSISNGKERYHAATLKFRRVLRLGPGAPAVEVELPATLKTGALGSELPVAGALGGEPEGALGS